MRKIILLGYMGCGKSTIAEKLSSLLQIPFVDLDRVIEIEANMTISQIFESFGEVYFRKLEHDVFVELLASSDKQIIGLGGGTPCYANNHELLKGEGITSIYLKASVATLFNRLAHNKSKRPIVANKSDEELQEFIAKHLFDRSYYYNQAEYKVIVDGKTIDETVADIISILT
ncbi:MULTISPECIES: shikimate kinase [Flavobacterium]|uniref:Shikimate kinase n=1 Tax=Flavobacterium keumense TaxID=1306518 RepID=A0ABY8N2S2_9FLAO|nr:MULTISPECIES: shikimate kinase [Flavobacterium]WGK93832.1 shikimate kinase [Flavobacterium keumense]